MALIARDGLAGFDYVAGAAFAAGHRSRLEAAVQRQESQRLDGALRIEDAPARRRPRVCSRSKTAKSTLYPTQAAGSAQPNAYIVTDAELQGLRLSLEYKWGEKKFAPRLDHVRDAGLLYHVHRDRPADWPASAEAQIQEGDTGDSWAVSAQRHRASSIRKPAATRCPRTAACRAPSASDGKFERTRHGRVNEYPGWNTLEVIVRGDRATHIVNGVVNMRVSDIKSWDAATQLAG